MSSRSGHHHHWRVSGLELPVDADERDLAVLAARAVGIDARELAGFRLVKKALDARRFQGVHRLRFAYQVELVLPAGFRSQAFERARRSGRVQRVERTTEPRVELVQASLRAKGGARVAVVGAGPAGLFAALILARHGLRVTLVDRGASMERRSRDLVRFHRTRVPDPESNLLFGEGGAGTYSDGKLYTRVDDPLEHALLEELVAAGADRSILYDGRAHIGTDALHRILPVLRARLADHGVEFAWNTRVEGLVTRAPGVVTALATTSGELACDAVLLAPGHSARDTWTALHEQGVVFEAKPFQLGVRIEHPQELVTRAQFGTSPAAATLGAASYALVSREAEGARAVHSFCMCPGGRIVASVNEPGLLCTNGMSNSRHSSRWANAALVVTLGPDEFGTGPFDGVRLQRELEQRFFAAGGGDYTAPSQRADDFLAGRASSGELATSYRFGARPARVDELLPPDVRDALRVAIARFDRTIPGFGGHDGLLVGLESRSSGPVRMPRDRTTRRGAGFSNLLPAGEGAGWAGGIMSAAIDGARSALALLEHGV